jgi:hypothetical protein
MILKGTLVFLETLAPGLHTISFKAWDVYNNPIPEIQFVVVGNDTLTLTVCTYLSICKLY